MTLGVDTRFTQPGELYFCHLAIARDNFPLPRQQSLADIGVDGQGGCHFCPGFFVSANMAKGVGQNVSGHVEVRMHFHALESAGDGLFETAQASAGDGLEKIPVRNRRMLGSVDDQLSQDAIALEGFFGRLPAGAQHKSQVTPGHQVEGRNDNGTPQSLHRLVPVTAVAPD